MEKELERTSQSTLGLIGRKVGGEPQMEEALGAEAARVWKEGDHGRARPREKGQCPCSNGSEL